jgi:phosphoglycolate phosphatase
MRLGRPRMVLIDVDGTLVDSVPDLHYCVDSMMTRLGLPERGEARVREWVGNGVERLVQRALVGQLEGEPDAELYERALPIFLACYGENTCRLSRLYPGALEAVQWLKQEGFRLGCVTNKAARFTEPLLETLGVRGYFQVVVSGDTVANKKPHPQPLLYAAERLGVAPGDALMVGDSVNDVEAARAAAFSIVCVSYGYNHGQDIREAGPDAVIDSLLELRRLLRAEAGAQRISAA